MAVFIRIIVSRQHTLNKLNIVDHEDKKIAMSKKRSILQIYTQHVSPLNNSFFNPSDAAMVRCFAVLNGDICGGIFTDGLEELTGLQYMKLLLKIYSWEGLYIIPLYTACSVAYSATGIYRWRFFQTILTGALIRIVLMAIRLPLPWLASSAPNPDRNPACRHDSLKVIILRGYHRQNPLIELEELNYG
jgi:hypothetical protein